MIIEEAIRIFRKSSIGKKQVPDRYVPYKGGYVLLIPNPSKALGCFWWWVKKDGSIVPANPLTTDWNQNDIRVV